ncbi:yhdW [Scenedesmus sp. PABB004]|nr:yhdW [Scenedesmus sp. PABB004]
MVLTLIAHRGDSEHYPENTLRSFDAALEKGFPHFETDTQLSADGVAVIHHDEALGRTDDGAGLLAARSAAELQALDAGAWFGPQFAGTRIPTLAQVLERYAGRAHIHLVRGGRAGARRGARAGVRQRRVAAAAPTPRPRPLAPLQELKSQQPALPAAVAALVRQHGWQELHRQRRDGEHGPGDAAAAAAADWGVPGLTITSFHLAQLQASKQLLPEVPHGWLIQEVAQEHIDAARRAGLAMLCLRANALTPEGAARVAAAGLAVRAWGVRSVELLHHVVACGAHGATVNWPAEAAAALAAAAPSERGA